jgi:peptide-methionine (S)-S-oxide reductase
MSSASVVLQSAVFGGGCFWCVEAVFASLRGVQSAQSGYCGGSVDHPSYEQVCTKQTGHIEVVKIDFDPAQITYTELLEVLFAIHDPTTPGRQGNDIGPQYQSAIFWQDTGQRDAAAAMITKLDATSEFSAPICTQLRPAATFWPAEAYHDNYFALHPEQGYCQMVVAPKVQKFRKQFASRLKS